VFTTDLVLREVASRPDFWAVASPLIWSGTGLTVVVPTGALTDLASIPRALRNIPNLDPDGYSRSAAVCHDWLYRTHQLSKADADSFLRYAIISRGGSAWSAYLFYLGVTVGGSSSYTCHPDGVVAADFDTQANYDAWRATDAGLQGY